LLVTETSSCEERKNAMIKDGRWQAMTPAEQAGILRQATQGPLTTLREWPHEQVSKRWCCRT